MVLNMWYIFILWMLYLEWSSQCPSIVRLLDKVLYYADEHWLYLSDKLMYTQKVIAACQLPG